MLESTYLSGLVAHQRARKLWKLLIVESHNVEGGNRKCVVCPTRLISKFLGDTRGASPVWIRYLAKIVNVVL